MRVRNVKRFVLSNDETIIYKEKNQNWNFEIFKMLFRIYKKGERYKEERMGERADSWPTPMLTSNIGEEKDFHI